MESVDADDGQKPRARSLWTTVPLSGEGTCIAQARELAADFLTSARMDHGVPVSARALALTRLVVSELVTNAHKYAPGPARMDLRITDTQVEVTVRDSARVRPGGRSLDPHRVGQHGLEIVVAVAERFHVDLEPSGKRVTAWISLLESPAVGPDHSASARRT
ncbi:ATP-binding protein [Streptomyces sp. NPDC002499]